MIMESIIILLLFENKSRCRLYGASCSSQYGCFLFDPYGDIYTCLELVGRKEFTIGTYLPDDKIHWSEVRDHWFKRNVGNLKGCQDCKYALLCGGPCLARLPYSKMDSNQCIVIVLKGFFHCL